MTENRRDIVTTKFAWHKPTVEKNLSDKYPDVSIDDLNNYMQCGNSHAMLPDSLDPYFKLMFGDAPQPTPVTKCICGHKIQVQCYICPVNDPRVENIIIVGSECIDKWTDRSLKGRRCEVCKVTHKNRAFNLCHEHIKRKKVVSRRFHAMVYNSRFNRSFVANLIEKRRSNQIKSIEENRLLLRKCFNRFRSNQLKSREQKRLLLRKCFDRFRSFVDNLRILSRLARTLLTVKTPPTPPTPIAVFSKRTLAHNSKVLLLLFKQFKVNWVFKYCTMTSNPLPLNPKLRLCIQHLIDNRNQVMPFGKLKHRTYNAFYKESTDFHKQYYLNIQNPDNEIMQIADYIKKRDCLRVAGYIFDIPKIVRTLIVAGAVVPKGKPKETNSFAGIPELVLIGDEEMNQIKLNNKQQYQESCNNHLQRLAAKNDQ